MEEKHICEKCQQEFKSKRALATHERFAHGEKAERHQPLLPDQIERLIDEWGAKTIREWAEEFGVPEGAVSSTVARLRKATTEEGKPAYLCPSQTNIFQAVLSKRGLIIPKK